MQDVNGDYAVSSQDVQTGSGVAGGISIGISIATFNFSLSFEEDKNGHGGIYFTRGRTTDVVGFSVTHDQSYLFNGNDFTNKDHVVSGYEGDSYSYGIGAIPYVGISQGYNNGNTKDLRNQFTTIQVGVDVGIGTGPASVLWNQHTKPLFDWQME